MRLIICVDDNGGMMFNKRRQSADCCVVDKICALAEGYGLRVNSYTKALFSNGEWIVTDEDCLHNATGQEYCFIENSDVSSVVETAEQIVLFRWNRKYPFDLRFPLEQLKDGWNLVHTEDFAGNSHKRITMEVYSR